jgi:hypothetical protein
MIENIERTLLACTSAPRPDLSDKGLHLATRDILGFQLAPLRKQGKVDDPLVLLHSVLAGVFGKVTLAKRCPGVGRAFGLFLRSRDRRPVAPG